MTEAILLVACLVLAAAVVGLGAALARLRDRAAQVVTALRVEQAAIERRLAALEEPPEVEGSRHGLAGARPARPPMSKAEDEYVITRLGSEDSDPEPVEPPDARLFADLVLRESVVKAASFAHGVRRGLAPENRNRIWFEMRREVKRARKQRKAEEREAVREWKARQRAALREENAA